MKKAYAIVSTAVLGLFSLSQTHAQINTAEIIKAGKSDGSVLMGSYLNPLLNSFGAGLNAGWYQTAKPLGLGGFNINVSANAVFAPKADQSFDVTKLNLQTIKYVNDPSNNPITPTVFGKDKPGSQMEIRGTIGGVDTSLYKFNLPQGMGFAIAPVPTAQVNVGVGLKTEIGVRYLPKLTFGDLSSDLLGFSVMHDIKQWIPGLKTLPVDVFDLSVMGGYTQFNGEVKFTGSNSIQASSDNETYNANPNKVYDNQRMTVTGNAWNANLLVSKKLAILTFYAGVGYQASSFESALKGDYPVTVFNDKLLTVGDPSFGKYKRVDEITDPIAIKATQSGVRANAGMRLKLAVFALNLDYTYANYSIFTAGLSIGMQSLAPPKIN